ncbi:hypothetical protein FPV67DRAFT_819293 [Lyophyllum atratum]|nr:hypothetical protein FPV67DRAFT_819293 [Lyophyllum atratum]
MPYKGACLCGNTIITIHSDHDTQIVCHCSDCKQSSGSAFSTNILPLQSEVTIIGTVKVFDMKAASGNIAIFNLFQLFGLFTSPQVVKGRQVKCFYRSFKSSGRLSVLPPSSNRSRLLDNHD